MTCDTAAIRHLAHQLRAQAEAICDTAARAVARAASTPWQGQAADAMRAQVSQHAADLRRVADLHDDAAAALLAHADAVDRTRALIAAVEATVHAMVSQARDRLAGVAAGLLGGAVDPFDDLLDRFVPPLTGSPDWLSVDLPGLPDLHDLGAAA